MTRLKLTPSSTRPTSGPISVEIKADDLEIDLEPSLAPIAKALAESVSDLIGGINETGADGHRLFNRTGHLREGIHAAGARMDWVIAAPPDRLNSPALRERLVDLVPELKAPAKLVARPSVKAATAAVVKGMVTVKKVTR